MKIFHLRGAKQMDWNVTVDATNPSQIVYPLPKRLDKVNHSPDGFSWGYNGSGPTQLAFAMLYDITQSDWFTQDNYMEFREQVISRLDKDKDHIIKELDIRIWCINQLIPFI